MSAARGRLSVRAAVMRRPWLNHCQRRMRRIAFLVLLPFVGSAQMARGGSGLRLGVVPSWTLLLGSVSHPWLTRRRSASMRCFPQPPARNDHRSVVVVASTRRYRDIAPETAVSRVLAGGDRDKQNMDVLRASQGRMP